MRRHGIAQLENHAGPREWDQLADNINCRGPLLLQKDVDLLQLIVDLAGVAASEQDEQIERVVLELQFALVRPVAGDLGHFYLPAVAGGIEPVENLHLGAFYERFVKRAPLVHVGCTDQECHLRTKIARDDFGQLLQCGLHVGGTAGHRISQETRVLEPDEFATAEKGQRL